MKCLATFEELKKQVDIKTLLEHLGAKFNSSGQSNCIFHKEDTPSLSIENSQKFKCFGCGKQGDIFDAIKYRENIEDPKEQKKRIEELLGLNSGGFKPQSSPGNGKKKLSACTKESIYSKAEKVYEYRDENGKLSVLVANYGKGKDGKKIIRQFSPSEKTPGVWLNTAKGKEPYLYRLPELIQAAKEKKPVFIAEGEKDVETLREWGYVATTNRNGASSRWREKDNKYFEGLEVFNTPDNDQPGIKHANDIIENLFNIASKITVVKVPGVKDVSDWKQAGGTKEKFEDLVKNSDPVMTIEQKTIFLPAQAKKDISGEEIELFTDFWSSNRFIKAHGNNIKFCALWNKWLIWDGKRWKKDDSRKIQKLAKKTVLDFYRLVPEYENRGDRKKLISHIQRSENISRIRAMIELSESDVPVLPEELDKNHWTLNCLNGSVNLKTGELKPHRQEDNITKIVNAEYDKAAECPLWLNFLSDIFDKNESLIKFIQKAVGYSLTGDTSEQCIFILHGAGRNGKSTFIKTITTLLEEYAQQTPAETLMIKKNSSSVNNDIARLKGVRLACSVETGENKSFSEVLLKQLTGGDKIAARFLHAEFFDFNPECKIWLATNHKPNIRGTDPAIWRRIRLIPFNAVFGEENADFQLPLKLQAELSGILKWAIEGCKLWQEEGLGIPEEVKTAVNEYRNEMDALGSFFEDCCYLDNKFTTPATILYKGYQKWCEESGEKYMTQRKFGLKMKERGFEKIRSNFGITRNKYIYNGILFLQENTKKSEGEQGEQNDNKVATKETILYNGFCNNAPDSSPCSPISNKILHVNNKHVGKYGFSRARGARGAEENFDSLMAEEVDEYTGEFDGSPF